MTEKAAETTIPAMTFAVRFRLYAFEQHGTATLLPWLQRFTGVTAVPGLPSWCLGLLNVRGTVQMAVDLGSILGVGASDVNGDSRLVFIEHASAQLGLLVDAEIGVRYLQLAGNEPAAGSDSLAIRTALLDGQTVTVLDGARIIQFVADGLGAPVHPA